MRRAIPLFFIFWLASGVSYAQIEDPRAKDYLQRAFIFLRDGNLDGAGLSLKNAETFDPAAQSDFDFVYAEGLLKHLKNGNGLDDFARAIKLGEKRQTRLQEILEYLIQEESARSYDNDAVKKYAEAKLSAYRAIYEATRDEKVLVKIKNIETVLLEKTPAYQRKRAREEQKQREKANFAFVAIVTGGVLVVCCVLLIVMGVIVKYFWRRCVKICLKRVQTPTSVRICLVCQQENNPSFSNCWKCDAPLPDNKVSLIDASNNNVQKNVKRKRIAFGWFLIPATFLQLIQFFGLPALSALGADFFSATFGIAINITTNAATLWVIYYFFCKITNQGDHDIQDIKNTLNKMKSNWW